MPSPRGGRWRGTRRMRGNRPQGTPSSVTCGDSFPQRGKPSRAGQKAFPRGGRWRGTRRMRGRLPQGTPSSVTCGDSFPPRGSLPAQGKKPSPVGEGGAPARRMRGNRPQGTPSSVTAQYPNDRAGAGLAPPLPFFQSHPHFNAQELVLL